jgi:hypothetical protein
MKLNLNAAKQKYKGISLPNKKSKIPGYGIGEDVGMWSEWFKENNIDSNEFINDIFICSPNNLKGLDELYVETKNEWLYQMSSFHGMKGALFLAFRDEECLEAHVKHMKELSILSHAYEISLKYHSDSKARLDSVVENYVVKRRTRYKEVADVLMKFNPDEINDENVLDIDLEETTTKIETSLNKLIEAWDWHADPYRKIRLTKGFQDLEYEGVHLPERKIRDYYNFDCGKNIGMWSEWFKENNIEKEQFIDDLLLFLSENSKNHSIIGFEELYIESKDERLYKLFLDPYCLYNSLAIQGDDALEAFMKHVKTVDDLKNMYKKIKHEFEDEEEDLEKKMISYIKNKKEGYKKIATAFKIFQEDFVSDQEARDVELD